MPLESLPKLVETLRARIDAHGDALRRSEALTRYALIDPLLRKLGWDTSNPDMVVPEYRMSNNQMADYVLLNEGGPVIVVESKRLDEPLQGGKALDQGILYCAHSGSKHFLLTDGRRWEIYEASSTEPRISFDLLNMTTVRVCLNALEMRLLNVYWHPMTEVAPTKARRPLGVMMPDGSRAPIKSWVDIPVAIVSWLLERGIIGTSHCPIQRGKRYLLSTSPVQPNGGPMIHKQIGSLFMGRNYSAEDQIRNACIIVEYVGKDPAEFKVRFS